MVYIALHEDGNYIEEAISPIDFVKKTVKYHAGHCKSFEILANSGQMTADELVSYANEHILTNDDAIESIYVLGMKVV